MKGSILIYDDDKGILELGKLILEKYNYNVETRASCKSLLEDISITKPGIILMDLWIPESGGEDAIRLIKNNESNKHIPVILFSAHDDIEKISDRANANGYLRKPFDINDLIELVENHILKETGTTSD